MWLGTNNPWTSTSAQPDCQNSQWSFERSNDFLRIIEVFFYFFKLSNNLVAVRGSEMVTIPSMVVDKVDINECTPVFSGMKYCSSLQYADAFSQEFAPFFPFTGDSK